MRRILFLSAIAIVSLLSFLGCDDENKIQNEKNDKPVSTDSIPAAVSFEYVDLGLSVYWATFNVGATKPEEYGDYYAWGEVEPYYMAGYAQENPQKHWKEGKADGYKWSNYKWCYASDRTMTKYCHDRSYGYEGFTDSLTVLVQEDDVAHVKWGRNWRIPTQTEWQELLDNSKWDWLGENNTEFGGISGYKVTSKKKGYTDRSIFLPAAGEREDTNLKDVDSYGNIGNYWSSMLYTNSPYRPCYAWYLRFVPDFHYMTFNIRSIGQSIRPVCPSEDLSIVLDSTNLSLSLISKPRYKMNATIKLRDEELNYVVTWNSDNDLVANVDNDGWVYAHSAGTVNITATYQGISATCKVTVTDLPLYENGFEYVDLGLSVKWATYNVGAEKPEDFGDHFAWGEVEPKIDYSFYNYRFYAGGNVIANNSAAIMFDPLGVELSKYNDNDKKTVLDSEDDVAHVKWGGNWHIPTQKEWQELIDSCMWKQYTLNGVEGYRISKGGASYSADDPFIFLPSAGTVEYDYFEGKDSYCPNEYMDSPTGIYWARDLCTDEGVLEQMRKYLGVYVG